MTENEAKLKDTFKNALGLVDGQFRSDLKIGDVPEWDSVGHLNLIFAVESDFGVRFEMEKIPELNTVSNILAEIQKLKS